MDNSLLKQILREYEQKRLKAIADAEARKVQLIEVNPKLQEIENQIAANAIEASKAILISDEKKRATLVKDLQKQNKTLVKEKDQFIKDLSLESNYFNPHFDCKMCKDTGYIQKETESVMCNCLKQRIFDIAYNKSNMGNLERENFNNFNYKVFSEKIDKEKYKSDISPRENMAVIREKVQSFIDNFDDPDEKNLIFTGNTGCGKTYLTNCIANEMLKKGKNVLYQTAPVMFNEINQERFNNDSDNSLYENILNVDLLIIDDLGTENFTDSKITELFEIVNARLLNQNHKITKTIISTNLNIEELFNIYTNRTGSRLVGNYRFLRFFGEDLRLKKAKSC